MWQLFTQMWVIPNVDDGKTDGFRLSDLIPGSLFSQMGLRDGDVVAVLAARNLTTPLRR